MSRKANFTLRNNRTKKFSRTVKVFNSLSHFNNWYAKMLKWYDITKIDFHDGHDSQDWEQIYDAYTDGMLKNL